MHKKFTSLIKPLLRSLVAVGLVLALALGHADTALAASGGGRIGGGSFRAPSRTYSPPRTYAPPGGGYGYPGGGYGYPGGGGFGFPFLFPVFGIGGGFGGLFTILIFLAIANFLVQSFRRVGGGDDPGYESTSSAISVAKLQVGLLAEARELQADLNKLAQTADTSSTAGLADVLQETTLALLRHPQYWMYGGSTVQQARLESAEAQFNRLLLAERSKFSGETLSNVNNQLRQASTRGTLPGADQSTALVNQDQGPGEYIVVTLLVGAQGDLKLPTVNSSEDMRQALQQLGGVSSDRLLALEVLWTPQAEGDVLTSDDLLVEYPELKLV
ncbi:DUF1517 domain-containing protein [Leptolyngbya sp. FACHB-36]|uniref:DUF1517 domain-containing protein n=1 Tax=Leptolyngbya sp. FACHB-36 TaxID=2692808 RepID=UPI00168036F4|nr:DUF1517 domain-containing protein [Leptolyngbya sp. FACHB-36]MBD2020992.1 DUF1517 domain-containing protein [Leptolyngbya sp. FACHB-36]